MLKTTKEIFIDNLKRLRKERFRSQELFAAKVEMSVRGYQKYEQGESEPVPEIIDRFSEALGCDPLDLLAEGGSVAVSMRAPGLTELKGIVDAPELADSLYLANLLRKQLLVAPVGMRALALRALFDQPELMEPYRAQLQALATPDRKKRSK